MICCDILNPPSVTFEVDLLLENEKAQVEHERFSFHVKAEVPRLNIVLNIILVVMLQ